MAVAVPSNVKSADSFKDKFGDEEVEKFKTMTGVKQSHLTSEHQTASDLGYAAAKNMLEKKGIDPKEINAIFFVSHSPDYRRPATAFVLQYRLGIPKEAVAYDISLGCSGFVYGLQAAASAINASEDIDKALVFLGDTAGKSVNQNDRSSVMLFGECGAVVLMEKTEEDSEIKELLRSDGSGYRYMIIPGGGYRNLHTDDTLFMCKDGNERSLNNSFIQGTSVFTFTIFDVPRLIKDFWKSTGTTDEDYDIYAMHQANLYILKQIAKKCKIPFEKMPISLDRYGNTSGASAIVTLCDKYGNSEDHKILKVLTCGFGIGISYGAASFEINTDDIFPIIEDDSIFEEGLITDPNQLYGKVK